MSSEETDTGVSRRRFFSTGAAVSAAGALAVGAAGGVAVGNAIRPEQQTPPPVSELSYPFYGDHQAGIATPPQDHLVFMSFDMTSKSATDLQLVLAKWSAAMAQMCSGQAVGSVEPGREQAVPVDTGEAAGLGPQGLTLTLGFGASLFDQRFGLAKFKPKLLKELPAMAGESLQAAYTGGDLCIQACAYDPQVAYHAVRNLARMARTQVKTRWTVLGFGRASAGANQSTPRNLMGFKDGTRNITSAEDLDQHVWAADSEQPWMDGGSYLVARKIHMLIETWDADYIGDQHAVFGRTKSEGAPLTGQAEHDVPDFQAKGPTGEPVIPSDSHVALAAHENNGGMKILRRGYNFTDGIDEVGRLDAGLFFISFQKDPEQFIRLQSKLGASDRLNEYIRHVGSALFAVPRGLAEAGKYFGQEFFS